MTHDHGGDGCSCGCGCGETLTVGQAEAARWRQAPGDAVVCPCAGVDKAAVLKAIAQGGFTAPLVKAMTGVGREPGCRQRRQCEADVETLVALYAAPPC